jgi:hypothetical protein
VSSVGDTGLQALHVRAAVKHALELFSYSQAVICEGFKEQFQQQVTTCAAEFALHARRLSEMNDLLGKPAPLVSIGQYKGGDVAAIKIETDYNHSLNRLIHAKSLSVRYVVVGEPILFPNQKNYVLSFLEIETDRREKSNVSVFGIAAHFLTMIAPAVLDAIRMPVHIKPSSEQNQ